MKEDIQLDFKNEIIRACYISTKEKFCIICDSKIIINCLQRLSLKWRGILIVYQTV